MALMVQGHVCDTLMEKAAKASALYQHHLVLRGLTGPLFFFISGFVFVVACDPCWESFGVPGPLLWSKLRRVAVLLGVGTFLQVPRWSGPAYTANEWHYLLRCGVLHAIGLSLLLGVGLLVLTRRRRTLFAWAAGALALLAIAAAPFASDAPGLLAGLGLLLRTQEGSLFPLTPWCAHFLLGAALARVHLDRPGLHSLRRLGLLATVLGGILATTGFAVRSAFHVDTHVFANWVSHPAVFVSRAGLAWLCFGVLAMALGDLASRRWLARVASHALSIFVAHLVLLYGWPGVPGLVHRLGPSLSLGQTYLAGPALFAASAALAVGLWWALRRGKEALRSLSGRLSPAAE